MPDWCRSQSADGKMFTLLQLPAITQATLRVSALHVPAYCPRLFTWKELKNSIAKMRWSIGYGYEACRNLKAFYEQHICHY
jgi:hypothetical protein